MKTVQRGDLYAEKKYFSKYQAIVIDNNDPRQLGRLILQVPEIFGTELQTDWATPTTGYLSAKNSSANNPKAPPDLGVLDPNRDGDKGDFFVPDIGDGVWAEFQAGDACRPLWSGRWWAEPGGGPETPMLARGVVDESQKSGPPAEFPKGTDDMQTATQTITQTDPGPIMGPVPEILDEPPVSYKAVYPHNRVLKTKQGIILELDDSVDENGDPQVRVHIWHPKKTWMEIHPDGTTVEHVQVRRYTWIEVDDDLHVKGNHNITVEGNATLHVKGNYTRHIEGNEIVHVEGDQLEYIQGNRKIHVVTEDKLWVEQNVTHQLDQSKLIQIAVDKTESIGANMLQTIGGNYTQNVGGNTLRTASVIRDQAGAIHHN